MAVDRIDEDIDAYNDGVKGNASKGILPAAERGVLDMDRQYNAVNFQFFAQQAMPCASLWMELTSRLHTTQAG